MTSIGNIFTLLILTSNVAWAGAQVGTLTQIEGSVKIFSRPTKQLQKDEAGTHALYEGQYYLVNDGKAGDTIEKGNIVRTAPGSRAQVIFPNGDQINVSADTAYKISWNKDTEKADTQINLMYGKMRGIVEKGGPRSHLQIRTKTAIMGVRGTDFFVAQGGKIEGTEVSIIRGAVDVKSDAPGAETVSVKAGYSAEIPSPPAIAPATNAPAAKIADSTPPPMVAPKVELRKTTQEDFKGIQRSLEVKTPVAPPSPEVAQVVPKLQQKAAETTLKDIKVGDQKLYAQLEQNKDAPKTMDELNSQAIQNVMQEAPKAPENHKPTRSEMDNMEDGAYEKYFKNVD